MHGEIIRLLGEVEEQRHRQYQQQMIELARLAGSQQETLRLALAQGIPFDGLTVAMFRADLRATYADMDARQNQWRADQQQIAEFRSANGPLPDFLKDFLQKVF